MSALWRIPPVDANPAVELSCSSAVDHRAPEPAERTMFDGFATAEVDVGETMIFIRRKGSGPPLLLLHGFRRSTCARRRPPGPGLLALVAARAAGAAARAVDPGGSGDRCGRRARGMGLGPDELSAKSSRGLYRGAAR